MFGKTATSGAASTNGLKYASREDDGTGLYHYRARFYSPLLHRFISEDPIGFHGGDINLYAYVSNDPINYVDPFGLDGESVWDLLDYVGSGDYEDHLWDCLSNQGDCPEGPLDRFLGGGGGIDDQAGFLGGLRRALRGGRGLFSRFKGGPLSGRGFRPPPGTRRVPDGIPESWRIRSTRGIGGVRYYDPSNPGNSVRVIARRSK